MIVSIEWSYNMMSSGCHHCYPDIKFLLSHIALCRVIACRVFSKSDTHYMGSTCLPYMFRTCMLKVQFHLGLSFCLAKLGKENLTIFLN